LKIVSEGVRGLYCVFHVDPAGADYHYGWFDGWLEIEWMIGTPLYPIDRFTLLQGSESDRNRMLQEFAEGKLNACNSLWMVSPQGHIYGYHQIGEHFYVADSFEEALGKLADGSTGNEPEVEIENYEEKWEEITSMPRPMSSILAARSAR
jgi:hypothetical protein